MWFKQVSNDRAELEIELQEIASMFSFAPSIEKVVVGETSTIIEMEKIEGDLLSDLYGDDPSEVPIWIWGEIRRIVGTLLDVEGIEYIDITPYNFIQRDDEIIVIDFGDAKYTTDNVNWFLEEFLNGENSWNPDFN